MNICCDLPVNLLFSHLFLKVLKIWTYSVNLHIFWLFVCFWKTSSLFWSFNISYFFFQMLYLIHLVVTNICHVWKHRYSLIFVRGFEKSRMILWYFSRIGKTIIFVRTDLIVGLEFFTSTTISLYCVKKKVSMLGNHFLAQAFENYCLKYSRTYNGPFNFSFILNFTWFANE